MVASTGEPSPADPLWIAARELEQALVGELLNYAGLDEAIGGGTGTGGVSFASFAVSSYAEQFVGAGGLGLTEKIYRQLKERNG